MGFVDRDYLCVYMSEEFSIDGSDLTLFHKSVCSISTDNKYDFYVALEALMCNYTDVKTNVIVRTLINYVVENEFTNYL